MKTLTRICFEVLGPLRVRCAGSSMKIVAAQHRTVMAVLLIHANRMVSVDHLIEYGFEPDAETRRIHQQVLCADR